MVLTIMEAKGKDAWGLLLVLLLGQLVAFSMAVSSFTSSLIATLGVDAPLTQSFFAYLLLTLVYVPILLKRRKKLQIPWYWYLALAFIDVQGNYLVVKAYQYSYITSVTLLDCWTVVWVVILTWYALGTRYSFWQFVGAGTCVAGLALVLLSDSKSADAQDPSKIPLLGDALVIAGTIFFAFSNVGEEYCVKKKDRVEFVAMFALFGLLLCLFAGFAVALFMFYSITPFVLKMSGSTLFNLSLLTSDMWAVAIRVLFYHQQVKNSATYLDEIIMCMNPQINWLYYIAFAVVAIGLIIYSLNDHSSDSGTRTTASTEAAAQYRQLPGEDNSTGISSNDSQERKQEEERAEKIRRSRKAIIPEGVLHHFLPPLKARERLMKTKSGPRSMMFLVFLGQLVSFSMAMPWYWYLALAFIDVQGNCLAIKAYHYSYITSVNLLNCWTITWVMILTRFALGTRYSLWQFVGAGTCMTGLALVLRSDSNYSDVQDESKRPLLGDALIIVATFCFAFSNVGEEYCVKNKDRIEFVAMLGIFGMLIGLFVGFAVASLVFSSIAPFVLKVNWLYYLAFAVVAIGLIIYSINESSDDETAASTMETETQYDYEQLSCE
uniref:EamA domain-containing protein n=1 Tax=Oryza meridionalis TaxID=40149 RepID=A0A0E0DS49_9ORYZ